MNIAVVDPSDSDSEKSLKLVEEVK